MMIDYSYLTPPSKVKRIKHTPQQIYQHTNGKHIRKIFNCPNYESFEREAIDKLRTLLQKKAPNIEYSDQLLLRFNYAGHFILSQALQKVGNYESWHQNQVIADLNKMGRQILQYGHIYAYGRDYDYCPIIIVKANKLDFKKYQISHYLNAVANLLHPLEEFMLVGGVIEKWNVIVDFQFKKHTIPLQVIAGLKKIAQAYPYRLKRLLLVNCHQNNQAIRQCQNILKGQESQAHTQVIKHFQQLNRYINMEQREIKYGGNLLNVCQFWPIHTTNKYQQTQSQFGNTEYQTIKNDTQFFDQPKPSMCDMGSSSCDIY